jgi:fluoride exporter
MILLHPLVYVALGGALGAVSRYLIVQYFASHWLSQHHLATMTVNIVGSFVMLFFMTLFMLKYNFPLSLRLFVAAGFLGSFTTFSTFSFETIHLFENGEYWRGIFNIVINTFGSLAAGFMGFWLAKVVVS